MTRYIHFVAKHSSYLQQSICISLFLTAKIYAYYRCPKVEITYTSKILIKKEMI